MPPTQKHIGSTANHRRDQNRLKDLAQGILIGYAQVFFSTRSVVGLIFMVATLLKPLQGVSGLAGLLLCILWAKILGLPDSYRQKGYFAFNGLLIGLALGLFLPVNDLFFFLLPLAALLGVFLTAGLNYFFDRHLFIPPLSAPFVLTTWITLIAIRPIYRIINPVEFHQHADMTDRFPDAVDAFFHSVGGTFFQVDALPGLIIAVGLILFSRFAFVLAVVGFLAGSFTYAVLKGHPGSLQLSILNFNFILTAIAVGGVWTVPGIYSLLLATIGAAMCALITLACEFLLEPFGLPPLAAPFVVTSGILLYALKHRTAPSGFRTVAIPRETPEKNLKQHRHAQARLVTGDIPAFNLPLSGKWTISQGFNGPSTHKDQWAHAWDFEIFDDQNKNWKETGSILDNYYAFNMPVFAPAEGRVVTVTNHIEDNAVGRINPENNWGNTVVLWHHGTLYSAISHLKQGSITVKEDDFVRAGQLIGKVGNSGRSPFPHLHFQAQTSHEIGAPTIPSELMHYVASQNHEKIYITNGCPREGDHIGPLKTENRIYNAISFPTGCEWHYWIRCKGKEWEETWETDIDFEGNRFLLCRKPKARIKFFVNRKVLVFLEYQGPRNSGLFWFFNAVPRLPATSETLCWRENMPGDIVLSTPARVLFDLLEPVYDMVRLSAVARNVFHEQRFSVNTRLACTGPLTPAAFRDIQVTSQFEPQRGLISLCAESDGGKKFELYARGANDHP
jgi:urea transporter/murein DD-endopeptidase MepM/ murein hydrolase activator NlpD